MPIRIRKAHGRKLLLHHLNNSLLHEASRQKKLNVRELAESVAYTAEEHEWPTDDEAFLWLTPTTLEFLLTYIFWLFIE